MNKSRWLDSVVAHAVRGVCMITVSFRCNSAGYRGCRDKERMAPYMQNRVSVGKYHGTGKPRNTYLPLTYRIPAYVTRVDAKIETLLEWTGRDRSACINLHSMWLRKNDEYTSGHRGRRQGRQGRGDKSSPLYSSSSRSPVDISFANIPRTSGLILTPQNW